MPRAGGQTKTRAGWIVELPPEGAVVGGGAVCRAARVVVCRGAVVAGAVRTRGAVVVVRGAAERAGGVVGLGVLACVVPALVPAWAVVAPVSRAGVVAGSFPPAGTKLGPSEREGR